MSGDVVAQLRSYLETVDTSARPITVAELEAPLESSLGDNDMPATESVDGEVADTGADVRESSGADLTVFDLRVPESPAPGPRTRRALVLTVAAAMLLVVGVVVVADGDSGDVVTEPVSSATTPDAVASPTAPDPTTPPEAAGPPPSVVDSSGYRWSRVADGCCPGGASPLGQMLDVTVGGPGLVAVGSDGSNDFVSDAVVWTSVDGITWSRLAHDEAVFGGGWMESVTVGGPGLVAVGSSGSKADGHNAAVWTSVDGVTWSQVPHDEEIFGGSGSVTMSSVTVGGPGLVAIGAVGLPARYQEGFDSFDDFPAVWTSVDGLTWSRVPHDEEIFGGPGEAWMSSLVNGGPGLVAVGYSGPIEDGDLSGAVWTSVDGLAWSRVPADEAVFGEAGMSSVTVGGPGLVAVGEAAADDSALGDFGDGAVWTSVDGLTWSRVPQDDTVLGGAGGQGMAEVIVGGPGLVAVGKEGYCDGSMPGCEQSPNGHVAVVWTSVDGITWSRVPHDDAVFGDVYTPNVTVGGPGLVAVGYGGVIVAEPAAPPED